MSTYTSIARIENKFLFSACYNLSAREQKVILCLISKLNPKLEDFHRQTISVRELQKILKGGESYGSLYSEMSHFRDTIVSKGIRFNSEIEIDGRPFDGVVNWFQSIQAIKDESGKVMIEFLFSEPLKPFLLNLTEYVQISMAEIIKMKSGFAIRLFQVLKAHRRKMAKHQKKSELKFTIEELKELLGIANKYKDFRNFRKKVLEPVELEINEYSSIKIEVQVEKKGRRAHAIKFLITDSKKHNEKLLDKAKELTRSQIMALEKLTDYGIQPEIVIKKFFPKVGGSEFRGFEDWYFEAAIQIFETKTTAKTKKAKAGTFVKWFLDTFDEDQFSSILEIINARKKKMEKQKPEAFANRLEARDMTNAEFELQFAK